MGIFQEMEEARFWQVLEGFGEDVSSFSANSWDHFLNLLSSFPTLPRFMVALFLIPCSCNAESKNEYRLARRTARSD